jgi:hypothetical protein
MGIQDLPVWTADMTDRSYLGGRLTMVSQKFSMDRMMSMNSLNPTGLVM